MGEGDALPARRIGRGAEVACYATGFLSLGLVPMQAVAAPLWALELGAAPGALGLAVGMRSLGPLLFAIHGGALMDRFGAKAVMLRMAALCVASCVAFPLLPSIPALMALQFLFGLAQGLSWVGAQTLIGQWTRGDPAFAGRLSFSAILGTFAGPIVAGFAWDAGGATGAFGAMALWSAALLAAASALPRRRAADARPSARARDLLPNPRDYRAAFALLGLPVIAALMLGSFARLGIIAVQGSFYPVRLDAAGLDAATIGALIGAASLMGAPAALLAGPLARVAPQMWTLIGFIAVCILAMTATPFVSGLPAYAALALLFGAAMGVSQAQFLSLLGRHAPKDAQGLGVGLRTTFNRLGSFAAPVAMGAAAEAFGLTAAFLVAGALLAAATVAMAALAWRAKL